MGAGIGMIIMLAIIVFGWIYPAWKIFSSPKTNGAKKLLWLLAVLACILIPLLALNFSGVVSIDGKIYDAYKFFYIVSISSAVMLLGPIIIQKIYERAYR